MLILLKKKKKLNVSIKKVHDNTGTVVPKQGQLKWANAFFSVHEIKACSVLRIFSK